MGVNLIFKIAAVGILVSAMAVSTYSSVLSLLAKVDIYELFETIKNLFSL